MKSILNKARELFQYCPGDMCKFMARDLAVELAEYTQRWIPVDEELPTEQGCYLVKCKNSFPKNCDVVVAEFYEDNQTFYSESSDYPIHDVTHWRPILLS